MRGASGSSSLLKRPTLDRRRCSGDGQEHPRSAHPRDTAAVKGAAQHARRHIEIGNSPLPKRTDGYDVVGGASYKLGGVTPEGEHLAGSRVDGNHRGLLNDQALATHRHPEGGGANVDGDFP